MSNGCQTILLPLQGPGKMLNVPLACPSRKPWLYAYKFLIALVLKRLLWCGIRVSWNKSRPKGLQTPENALISETGSFGKIFMTSWIEKLLANPLQASSQSDFRSGSCSQGRNEGGRGAQFPGPQLTMGPPKSTNNVTRIPIFFEHGGTKLASCTGCDNLVTPLAVPYFELKLHEIVSSLQISSTVSTWSWYM